MVHDNAFLCELKGDDEEEEEEEEEDNEEEEDAEDCKEEDCVQYAVKWRFPHLPHVGA